jgi:hypothetical protein
MAMQTLLVVIDTTTTYHSDYTPMQRKHEVHMVAAPEEQQHVKVDAVHGKRTLQVARLTLTGTMAS